MPKGAQGGIVRDAVDVHTGDVQEFFPARRAVDVRGVQVRRGCIGAHSPAPARRRVPRPEAGRHFRRRIPLRRARAIAPCSFGYAQSRTQHPGPWSGFGHFHDLKLKRPRATARSGCLKRGQKIYALGHTCRAASLADTGSSNRFMIASHFEYAIPIVLSPVLVDSLKFLRRLALRDPAFWRQNFLDLRCLQLVAFCILLG